MPGIRCRNGGAGRVGPAGLGVVTVLVVGAVVGRRRGAEVVEWQAASRQPTQSRSTTAATTAGSRTTSGPLRTTPERRATTRASMRASACQEPDDPATSYRGSRDHEAARVWHDRNRVGARVLVPAHISRSTARNRPGLVLLGPRLLWAASEETRLSHLRGRLKRPLGVLGSWPGPQPRKGASAVSRLRADA